MTYRNQQDADRARLEVLEQENEELRRRNKELKTKKVSHKSLSEIRKEYQDITNKYVARELEEAKEKLNQDWKSVEKDLEKVMKEVGETITLSIPKDKMPEPPDCGTPLCDKNANDWWELLIDLVARDLLLFTVLSVIGYVLILYIESC